MSHLQQPPCRPGRKLPLRPLPPDLLKIFRARLFRSSQLDAPQLRRGDALRLPLADQLPLRLGHIAEQLQDDIRDQRPGKVPAFARVQQRHIQHNDLRPPFLG